MLQKTISLQLPDPHLDHGASNTVFGFWLYLMTDCIIFASLFAVFAVMGHQFAGGPSGKDIFEIPGVAVETAILLLSSITFGFGMLAAHKGRSKTLLAWLGVTFGHHIVRTWIKSLTQWSSTILWAYGGLVLLGIAFGAWKFLKGKRSGSGSPVPAEDVA